MEITRGILLRFIARHEPVDAYPLIETGQMPAVRALEGEGLVEVSSGDNWMVCLTDKGRRELDKLETSD
jgi:hypothetical protein